MPTSPINHASRVGQSLEIPTRSLPSSAGGAVGAPKFASVLDHAKVGDSSSLSSGGFSATSGGLNAKAGSKDNESANQAKIEASCRQFEGIMVKQILTASKLPLVGGTGGGGAVGSIYNDLVVQTLSDQITEGGGIGLASAMQTQLSRQHPAGAKGSTPAATH